VQEFSIFNINKTTVVYYELQPTASDLGPTLKLQILKTFLKQTSPDSALLALNKRMFMLLPGKTKCINCSLSFFSLKNREVHVKRAHAPSSDSSHRYEVSLLLPEEQRGAREESACTASFRFQSQV
jgi:hypothetical protein